MRWESTLFIAAPADEVWRLTIDITNWPSFTPTMQRVERLDQGPVRVGSTARVKQPGQMPAVWTVTRLEPGREFTWQTKRMGTTMTGSHIVESSDVAGRVIVESGDVAGRDFVGAVGNGCRNTLSIDVSGPLAGLFGLAFGGLFRKALETENAGFKAKAEL
jgi:uncharacterized membrane protein